MGEDTELMAVPASYNDQKDDPKYRNHYGWAYYERKITVPSYLKGQRLVLRFDAVTHAAKVYLNGRFLTAHKGGFLPFEVDVTDQLVPGETAELVVAADNRVNHSTLPVGNEGSTAFFGSDNPGVPSVEAAKVWRKPQNLPNFDFFNYAGINRPVRIYTTPAAYIDDITLVPVIDGDTGVVNYEIKTAGSVCEDEVRIRILDADGNELDGSLLRVTNAGVTLRTVTVEQNLYPTKTLTVSDLVRLEGEPAAGYEVKSVTITPVTVLAAGDGTALDTLDTLFTTSAIDLDDRSEGFATELSLRKPSTVNYLSTDTVTVQVEIEPIITTQSFSGVKLSVRNIPEGLSAGLAQRTIDVDVTGPQNAVSRLSTAKMSAYVDASGLTAMSDTVLPDEMVSIIEDVGFLESIPLWAVTLLGSLFIWVLSLVMILTVYSRFFKLYMATAIAPIPLASFAGQPSSSIGVSFVKSYAAICLEGCIIVLACIIFSQFATAPPAIADDTMAAATIVWNYVGELVFNMLVLVGAVKMSDRLVRELMGLG